MGNSIMLIGMNWSKARNGAKVRSVSRGVLLATLFLSLIITGCSFKKKVPLAITEITNILDDSKQGIKIDEYYYGESCYIGVLNITEEKKFVEFAKATSLKNISNGSDLVSSPKLVSSNKNHFKKNDDTEYFPLWLSRLYAEKIFKKSLELDYSAYHFSDEYENHTRTQFFKDYLLYRKKYSNTSWQVFVFSKKTHKTYFCSDNHVSLGIY
jgi:hypothetical protein